MDSDACKLLDEFIREYGDIILEREKMEHVTDINMVNMIKFTEQELRNIISGAKIQCFLHRPFKSLGYISIEGKNIRLKNPAVFAELAKFASNIEMFPMTNGKAGINLGYSGIARIVAQEEKHD